MWEVLSFGDKPYGEMNNQEVSLDCFPMSSLTHLLSLLNSLTWSFSIILSFQLQFWALFPMAPSLLLLYSLLHLPWSGLLRD